MRKLVMIYEQNIYTNRRNRGHVQYFPHYYPIYDMKRLGFPRVTVKVITSVLVEFKNCVKKIWLCLLKVSWKIYGNV